MELKTVHYFLQIVDQGSLSKAAESLFLTQPALSRFLAKLEESAGIALFHRKRDSSLELTEAGKVYLQTARQIDALWRAMEAELNSMKDQGKSLIRLGFDTDSLYPLIQSASAVIAQRYPNLSLESHHLYSGEIHSAIQSGSLDIGFTSFFSFHEQFTYTGLVETEIDMVVSHSHPLAKFSYKLPGQEQTRMRLTDLPADTPFLLMREGHVLRQRVDSYMQTLGLHPHVPTTFFRLDLLGQILTGNDTLVSFCPRSKNAPDLAPIALDPPFFHQRGICYRRGKKLTGAEQLLIDLLCDGPEP